MKKNDMLLMLCAIAFSGLFYKQLAGINALLFTLMISAILPIFNPGIAGEIRWWLYALCSISAGLAVFINASALSIFALHVSLLILASKAYVPRNSIMANGLFALYSLARTPFDIASGSWKYFNDAGVGEKANRRKLIIGIPIALLISIFFLLLYREANPLFKEFTEHLDLSWINVSWILFTVLGLIIAFGLTHSRTVSYLADLDLKWLKNEERSAQNETGGFDSNTVIAVTLFGLLNVMLLIINYLDIWNIYVNGKLPAGVTLSDFVHQAVESVILSILIGITFIAWLFKGALNFSRNGKWARLAVYAWIIQSALMVMNTIVRNYWYINEYQLTEQRIGVYVFLGLCLCGLLLTFLKLRNCKSAWWLVEINAQTWFLVLIFSSLVNWDRAITDFNLSRSGLTHRLDKEYLLKLGQGNLTQLTVLHNNGQMNRKERTLLYKKLLRAYKKNRFQQWPGYSLKMNQCNNALMQLELK